MSESKDQNTSVDSKEEEYSINNCTLYVFTKTKQVSSLNISLTLIFILVFTKLDMLFITGYIQNEVLASKCTTAFNLVYSNVWVSKGYYIISPCMWML